MKKSISLPLGLYYQHHFVKKTERAHIIHWLQTLAPLWEMRFSEHNPPPEGDKQRQLKRPVYWLGNWQFACLDYYHPPKGIQDRCVKAEPYPELLQKIVDRIEFLAKKNFPVSFFPKAWELNTCLINFYGSHFFEGKWVDVARVGEHKDFEPGPVASLSIGERAFFQFVAGQKTLGDENQVFSMWLDDSSLQIFGGDKWKNKTFHRVQRVENKKELLPFEIANFKTRRVNFTFRYVPREHIKKWQDLSSEKKKDTLEYVEILAKTSPYFRDLINSDK